MFWKRGRVCIHLEQIWLKQVSSSNCLGRGPWGINCTTDENYWGKKSNGRTQKDEWQRLKTGKRMIRWSRLKEGQDVWGEPNLTQYQFLHNVALIYLQRIKKRKLPEPKKQNYNSSLFYSFLRKLCESTYDKMYPQSLEERSNKYKESVNRVRRHFCTWSLLEEKWHFCLIQMMSVEGPYR